MGDTEDIHIHPVADVLTASYRVFVCDNMAFHGDFTSVLAKHSKRFSLVDALSVGVDRMQRNFEPMRKQVEQWKELQFPETYSKFAVYQAFIEGGEGPHEGEGQAREKYLWKSRNTS
jgi:hypothetical protein